MEIFSLIYSSQPFGYDQAMLNGILTDAKNYNPKNNITGALICREDIYLQLLEGPKLNVEKTYERILEDDRHVNVNKLIAQISEKRIFPDWYMKDDPARSWFWSPREIASDILSKKSERDILEVFIKVAAEIT